LLALAILVGLLALYHLDPVKHGFYPRCQLNALTGLQCPGCGGLRALHALLHVRVAEAFRLNPLFVAAVPAALALAGRWLWRRRREPGARWVIPAGWLWSGVAAVILFGIVRNLPGVAAAWGGS
jgi:hypothetical protein